MSKANWRIGERIGQQEQNETEKANYGNYIISNLSKNFQESLERDFLLQIKKIVVSSIVLILKIQLATRRVANYRGLI